MKFKLVFALLILLSAPRVDSFAQVKPATIPLDNLSELQPRNVKTNWVTYKGKTCMTQIRTALPQHHLI
jgi:hypothetical protein